MGSFASIDTLVEVSVIWQDEEGKGLEISFILRYQLHPENEGRIQWIPHPPFWQILTPPKVGRWKYY